MSTVFRKAAYAAPVRPQDVQADFPGFSFGTFRDPPGQVWPDFTHPTDEFVVVAQGHVEITVGDETAVCAPGDLVSIPANTVHTLRTSRDGGSVWHYGYGQFGGNDE